MKILKFELSGRFAFFKNPEVNSIYFFTYNNIHKVALLGILGSILGLKGYNQQGNADYPEFYEKMKDLKIAVVPKSDVCPNKKIQVFNNSTMFYNKGADKHGANLIVKEEWIENPVWDIYVEIDTNNPLHVDLMERVINRKFVYTPYLGKNDHFANILNIEVFNEEQINPIKDDEFKLDSLYISSEYKDVGKAFIWDAEPQKYKEKLPCGLASQTNLYLTKSISHYTGSVRPVGEAIAFCVNGVNISYL